MDCLLVTSSIKHRQPKAEVRQLKKTEFNQLKNINQ